MGLFYWQTWPAAEWQQTSSRLVIWIQFFFHKTDLIRSRVISQIQSNINIPVWTMMSCKSERINRMAFAFMFGDASCSGRKCKILAFRGAIRSSLWGSYHHQAWGDTRDVTVSWWFNGRRFVYSLTGWNGTRQGMGRRERRSELGKWCWLMCGNNM